MYIYIYMYIYIGYYHTGCTSKQEIRACWMGSWDNMGYDSAANSDGFCYKETWDVGGKMGIWVVDTRWCPPSYKWIIIPLTIDISPINIYKP